MVEDVLSIADEIERRRLDRSFSALRINSRTEAGWAVVGDVSGAIALDEDGDCLMRLTQDEAEAIALRMTQGLRLHA